MSFPLKAGNERVHCTADADYGPNAGGAGEAGAGEESKGAWTPATAATATTTIAGAARPYFAFIIDARSLSEIPFSAFFGSDRTLDDTLFFSLCVFTPMSLHTCNLILPSHATLLPSIFFSLPCIAKNCFYKKVQRQ